MKNAFFLLILSFGLGWAAEPTKSPHVVFMIGEDEYKTWETLPIFAKSELESRGVRVTVVQADAKDKNNFPGLVEALKDADALFVSVRRRTPVKAQLDAVHAHLDAGKPLVGIRTACHAFALRPNEKLPDSRVADWAKFDPEVLGGNYVGHHGNELKSAVSLAPGAVSHPILNGVDVRKLEGNGSLYRVSPLNESCTPLLMGTIPDKSPEPIAWTRLYGAKHSRIFYTSLGHSDDFASPEFRRLLVNGISWALQQPLKAKSL